MGTRDRGQFRASIQHHSKSFSFAATLLPRAARRDVEVLYAWCRRTDDAIDLAPSEGQPAALTSLRDELAAIYGDVAPDDALGAAMHRLVRAYRIPRSYPEDLVAGMDMDVRGVDYPDVDTLLLYCYRVAGTVGLMMSHVLGVRDPDALQHAVHLGIAMQLTNICRDVAEDAARGRVYLPRDVLERHGAREAHSQPQREPSLQDRGAMRQAVRELLDLADAYYASAERGCRSLPWRAAVAVRAARRIYGEIGTVIRKRDHDVFGGRAFVPRSRKLVLGLRALATSIVEVGHRIANRHVRTPLGPPLRFPDDIVIL